MGGGKERGGRPAGRDAEDHGAFRANRIEHRTCVFDPMFYVDVAGPIGKPHASLVEQDEATERRQSSDETISGSVPPHIEMAHEPGNAKYVDRSVADDLIR